MTPARILAFVCRDWPITAAGRETSDHVVIVQNNIVVACSAAARDAGVSVGLRRREAQSRLPDVEVLSGDFVKEHQMFEPLVVALESVATTVELLRPGICLIETRGPSRYFGGDRGLVDRINEVVADISTELIANRQIGIAEGVFGALLAAERNAIIKPGATPSFLAPLPIETLNQPKLTSLLRRLGLCSLGDFAALAKTDVMARFGPDGAAAHQLASGVDEHHLAARTAIDDLAATTPFDPPEDRVDAAAFVGRSLAAQLLERLSSKSLTCSRVTIEVVTEHEERRQRNWRFDGCCDERSLGERVRWQLDGWLSGSTDNRPSGGLIKLTLTPTDVRPNTGEQVNFWDVRSEDDERAARGFARVQALLGPSGVAIPSIVGGRSPLDRFVLTPWGEQSTAVANESPWPNRLPSPSPSTVTTDPQPIDLHSDRGVTITASKRGVLSSQPHLVCLDGQQRLITDFAGPWTVDDQWWDTQHRSRGVYLQVVVEDGDAFLLWSSKGRWYLAGCY